MPLTVSQVVLAARQREIESIQHLASRTELVDVLGQLIHALQRERGATSVYLASGGQRFADVRQAAIGQAQPLETQVRDAFERQAQPEQGASSRMLSLMAWVLLDLDALRGLRAAVDQRAWSAHDSVAAFSRLLAGMVELVFLVADATLNPRVSRLLVACVHLLQGMEAAGQERAIGALLLASGQLDEGDRQRMVHLIDAQERSLKVFDEFAPPDIKARWAQHQLSSGSALLERLRRTLCTARADTPLDAAQNDAWFSVCSERIDELWQLQCALTAQMRADCSQQIERAQQELSDTEGLLRQLRDNPPAHTHAVDRFFDPQQTPQAAPVITPPPTSDAGVGEQARASLVELLEAQTARLARMEAELAAARRTLNDRKVIDRAKGLLMSRLGMTEDVAFRTLQKTAMDQNRRLVDVAEAMLALPDFAFAARAKG